jgi:4-amino-4-deoxy-L-arabinose transferase-like glycosyltransferase
MDTRRRRVVLGLLLAGLVLRLAFVCRLPAVQLYWDEPHYDGFGKVYADVWSRVGEPAAFLSGLRAAFERTIQKGEAYSATIGLVYAIAGPHPRAVLILQAVGDTLACLFVYGIAVELGGGGVGIVALVLATLYEPFIFTAARLQSEALSSCIFLGALWAIVSAARRREVARHVLAGILLALAMLMRQALQYMFPLVLVIMPVLHPQATWRRRICLALAFSAGFFLLIGPRLVVTNQIFGHPIWGGARDPSVNAYAGVIPDNLGWQTDHLGFVISPGDELLAVLQARGASSPTERGLRRAMLLIMWRHPLDSAAVVLHKLYQAWSHPYNDLRWRFITGRYALAVWHKLMLVLAVIGLPLALRNPRVAVPLIAVSGYLWGMYLAVDIEVRHALPVLPLLLCFAALAVVILSAGVRALWRAGQTRRLMVPALFAGGLVGLLYAFPEGRLLEIAPTLSPIVGNELRTVALLLVMLLCGVAICELLRGTLGPRWALAAGAPALIMGTAVFLVGRPLANVWHRWTCPLGEDRQIARQEFILPADLLPPPRAELRLDLMGARAVGDDLIVTVNGVEARRFVGGPSRDDAVLPPIFYMDAFNAQSLQPRPWRGWYAVPVPLQSLVPASRLDVEVRLDGHQPTRGTVSVVGDYPSDGELTYDGPSPFAPQLIQDTSLYRYVNAGDWRMRRRVPLHGVSRSRFFNGRGWSSTDLSPAPGRQFGRYRVLLLLRYPDGQTVVF